MSIATETDACTCEWDVNDELMTLDMHCPDHGYLWDGDGADLTQEQTTGGWPPLSTTRDKHDRSL